MRDMHGSALDFSAVPGNLPAALCVLVSAVQVSPTI